MSEKLNIIIVDKEETSRSIIKNYLSEIEDTQVIAEFFDYDMGLSYLPKVGKSVLLIDISDDFDKAVSIISTIKEQHKNIYTIALSNKTTTNNIIKVMRSGAKEFITKPITQSEFKAIINNVKKDFISAEDTTTCKIISTFSNKGGIGKTSIAVNLAVELAQMSKEKVALIDLNLQLGDVSTFLDVEPSFEMDYMADNIDNLDKDELLKTMTRYKNTSLYVIADPLNIEKTKDITAEQIKKILDALKKVFSYIVIDIGTNIDTKTVTALNYSDLILLIAIVNLPAIRSTQRCMNLFNKLGYPKDKIRLVLNRYMENDDIKATDIEDVVKQKVYWKIPNNYLTMMSAINKGAPVSNVSPEANISVNYKEFASRIADSLITEQMNKKYNIKENRE